MWRAALGASGRPAGRNGRHPHPPGAVRPGDHGRSAARTQAYGGL